jgi:putative transposase
MIDRNHKLALTKQAALLGISRGSVYYEPAPVSAADLALMRRLDELHLEFPFAGARMLRGLLAAEGSKVGRRHVTTLMRRMGIEAIYRRPNTSKPAPGHRIYPYLLRGLTIDRPNHVWATDITYIPMARGFVYLAAVMDWFARRILAWRLSNTMEASFCVDAVEDALARHGCPQIFNTDQGSQFTSAEFTSVLINNGISISMDGKGAWRDNVFVERFWRTIKYEEVYLHAYDGVGQARQSIGRQRIEISLIRGAAVKSCVRSPCVVQQGLRTPTKPSFENCCIHGIRGLAFGSVFTRRLRNPTAFFCAVACVAQMLIVG